jgi:hypothetical protein
VIAGQGEQQEARQLLADARGQTSPCGQPVGQVLEQERRAPRSFSLEARSHDMAVIGAGDIPGDP